MPNRKATELALQFAFLTSCTENGLLDRRDCWCRMGLCHEAVGGLHETATGDRDCGRHAGQRDVAVVVDENAPAGSPIQSGRALAPSRFLSASCRSPSRRVLFACSRQRHRLGVGPDEVRLVGRPAAIPDGREELTRRAGLSRFNSGGSAWQPACIPRPGESDDELSCLPDRNAVRCGGTGVRLSGPGSAVWIIAGALVIIGLGFMAGIVKTRQKDLSAPLSSGDRAPSPIAAAHFWCPERGRVQEVVHDGVGD